MLTAIHGQRILCLTHETEVGVGAEVAEVGEDCADLTVGKTEPTGERACVLLDGGGGDESSCAEVINLIDADNGILAVHVLAVHRAANNEVMAAPTVIGSVGVGGEGAAEVGDGE